MKNIAKKEKAYAIYNEMAGTIHDEITGDFDEALKLRKRFANFGQMPRESMEDAMERYKIVECIISYRVKNL